MCAKLTVSLFTWCMYQLHGIYVCMPATLNKAAIVFSCARVSICPDKLNYWEKIEVTWSD